MVVIFLLFLLSNFCFDMGKQKFETKFCFVMADQKQISKFCYLDQIYYSVSLIDFDICFCSAKQNKILISQFWNKILIFVFLYEITHRPVIGVRGARVFESPQLSGGLRPARHFGFQNPAGLPGRPRSGRSPAGRLFRPAIQ